MNTRPQILLVDCLERRCAVYSPMTEATANWLAGSLPASARIVRVTLSRSSPLRSIARYVTLRTPRLGGLLRSIARYAPYVTITIFMQHQRFPRLPEGQQTMRSENGFQRHYDGASLRPHGKCPRLSW